MKNLKILFPCDYFNKKEADEAYANEYAIAKSLGFDCIVFDYDEFLETKKIHISSNNEPCNILYRGWMLKLEDYCMLDKQLCDMGLYLINDTDQYELCHHFDNAYQHLKNVVNTPKTEILNLNIDVALLQIQKNFTDYFIMKDNVKSVKGTDFPNKISVDISVEDLEKLMNQFKQHRDKLFTGQIIAKQYVELKKYGDTTNEWRAFYFFNKLISVSRNSNQPKNSTEVPGNLVDSIINIYRPVLNSNFYTVDFAELENGNWVVIETGDGQVSGLSSSQHILHFYTQIQNCWERKVK